MNATRSSLTPSPCIGVCAVRGRYCVGCYRTLREIGSWSSLGEAERKEVLKALPYRRESAEKADWNGD